MTPRIKFVGPVLLLILGTVARADLIVTFSDPNIQPGTQGFIDVFVEGSGDPTDVYVQFDLTIGIKPFVDNQPNSILKFLPTVAQSTSYISESNYVFPGPKPPGLPLIAVPPSPLMNEAAITDISIIPELIVGKKLLTRLQLTHDVTGGTDPALAAGNQFEVFAASAEFFKPPPPFPPPPIPVPSVPGTVTALEPIPEPGSLGIFLIGVVLASLAARHRTPETVGRWLSCLSMFRRQRISGTRPRRISLPNSPGDRF